METIYPLGHGATEIDRLEKQAGLLDDPLLGELAASAEKVLEIGSGAGSNWPVIKRARPGGFYLGTDFSPDAVRAARSLYRETRAEFRRMDATCLDLAGESFDLVFSKLVLWGIGPAWPSAVAEAFRVLKPGGVFYAFEPYDPGVVFSPAKPAFEEVIRQWREISCERGADPAFGAKLPAALANAGFHDVRTKAFPVLAARAQSEAYRSICENLRRFYLSEDPGNPARLIDPGLLALAEKEIGANGRPEDFALDFFFVSWGVKP